MRAYERLLRYVAYPTASNENSSTVPSTPEQVVFGKALVEEMLALGIKDARIDETGYVYGSIPANMEGQPVIGLIAHMDTVDCCPWDPVHPVFVEKDGKQVIATDGTTLLGADDKAGVAEIMTMCENLLQDPSRLHGKICIAFTPDEEIGRGADHFDVPGFGADFAYTVDGGLIGEVAYETFNAAAARVTVNGVSIHPGTAKGVMKNAITIASEFIQLLPPAEAPEYTCDREGFYHVVGISGTVEKATVDLIIRDHDRTKFEERKKTVEGCVSFLKQRHGDAVVSLDMKDSYYNMAEVLKDRMDIVERANNAMTRAGVEPFADPVRGGTDGSRLSYMGLPCPNLCTGGMNFHGRNECIPVEDMDTVVTILENIVTVQ